MPEPTAQPVSQPSSPYPRVVFLADLTRPTFAIIADSQGVGYIVNDDGTSGSVIPDEPSQ